MPTWLLESFVNTFAMFFMLFLRPWAAKRKTSRAHIGIGAFNLVRRAVFEKIEGFRPIKMRPDDDLKFGKLVKLTVAQSDRGEAETTGRELATRLRERAAENGARVDVAGPAPAFVARRGDRWRFNVVLRGEDPVAVLGDPPGAPWSIDVDPESLL